MRAGAFALIVVVGGLAIWTAMDSGGGSDAPEGAESIGAQAKELQDAGDHAASATRFEQAAKLALADGRADLARGYRAQAGVCFKLAGSLQRAHEIMLEVLLEAREVGHRRHEGLALGNLARLEDMGGDLAAGLDYLDELIALASEEGDTWLEVRSLEQAATAALLLGDPEGARARIQQGLSRDEALPAEDSRRPALLAQLASVRAAQGDDEGAEALWDALTPTPASLANRARHLSDLGQHGLAAELALEATQGFVAEGLRRGSQRDRALALHISELLHAGELDACALQLERLLRDGQPAEAQAPFKVLSARLALARRRAPDAIEPLRSALDSLPDIRDTELVSLLLAVALHQSERDSEAMELLDAQPESQARALLRTWILTAAPPEDALIGELEVAFRSDAFDPADDTLDQLVELVPSLLPSRAFVALEAGLSDTVRLRTAGADAMAQIVLTDAVHEALAWQAIDARRAVFGLKITPEGIAARSEVIHELVRGRMSADRALIAVIPGERASYLLLCTAEIGATSFSIQPASVLASQAGRVVAALRGDDLQALASEANRMYTALFGRRAREDLAQTSRWTLVLPDALACVPPALLVTEEPVSGSPIAWLVRERVVSVLPHVTAARPQPESSGRGWLTVHAPSSPGQALTISATTWTARYGPSVWSTEPVRGLDPARELRGDLASVPLLAAALPNADGLRISAPGAGAGRLGGIALSPHPAAATAGEQAGLLPWHRLAALDLPADVILDGTRFDLGEGFGPSRAATAVLSRARRLLLARWPLPAPLRDTWVERVQSVLEQGVALDIALVSLQREYLATAEAAGKTAATHPRFWAALIPYGSD